ncbi:hypothetical protein VOI54_03255 [Tamlana sp. 2201CG12-4]|uniref:hypothetical protein n=1 Tax=Tamlana sp. 2201CG12-4 TaxID=3112582 RepID=UPI002DBCFAFA|nr:hypothetical protein [Tamlana sp. 2201CG12-4]MEC3906018.1 hypothetical protein [Tamlana sp. 2201CG12-4]
MRLKYLVILIFLNLSCNSQKSFQEVIDVYNVVIDKAVKPLPTPPPEPGDNSSMPLRIKDSLRGIKLNIAVSNRLELYDKQSFNVFGYEDYQSAKDNLIANKNRMLMKRNWFNTNLGHTLSIVDLNKIDKKQIFKEYYRLVFLSNIGFNTAKDKAIVIIGLEYGSRLSGAELLYFLDKIDGKWEIKHEKVISIS